MKATSRAKRLGEFLLGQIVGFKTRLVLYERHPKGRKDMNTKGDDIRKDKRYRSSAAREKEPWLLATSLCTSSTTAKRIIKFYATRMQIEESFRNVKTGLKMNDSRTRIVSKLNVLLIIASLSQFMLYLLGLAVKAADKHKQYQAKSIKHRNVLSNQFIGLRAYKDRKLKLLKYHWRAAISSLKELVRYPQACY